MQRRKRGDYTVGYGKPPKHSRFRKGQSGNPRGRPKASRNVETMLKDILFRKITVTEDGKPKQIAALEAFFRQTLNGALKGDTRAADKVLKLIPMLQAALEREAAVAEAAAGAAARDDRPVLAALAAMLGGDARELFLADQEEAEDAG